MSVPDGLILWNTLGSEAEVVDSAYGPDLTVDGGAISAFVPGVFGGALTVGPGPYYSTGIYHNVAMPDVNTNLSANQGAVELWFNARDNPSAYEHNPYRLFDGLYGFGTGMTFQVRDADQTPGGDEARLQFYFDVDVNGTSAVQAISNTDGLPGVDIEAYNGTWIHLAAVWDRDGIGASNDTLRIYVNGIEVADSQESGWLDAFNATSADIGGGNDLIADRFAVDNIKVWDFAKTDFSDRFIEGFVVDPPQSLVGTAGGDTLTGASGSDTIQGLAGRDSLDGAGGGDSLYGGCGNDTVAGGDGDDRLWGNRGYDSLDGGTGDDRIFAGKGNDTVGGGAGDDTIRGGEGRDRLTGGDGADMFAFAQENAPAGELDWVQWRAEDGGNGHYYAAVSVGEISWTDAEAAAEAQGGYLATVTSAGENAFVFGLVSDTSDPDFWLTENNLLGPWLGGFQQPGSAEPLGGWEWVTGEPFSYSNWWVGEPNNYGDGTEDRLQLINGPYFNDVPDLGSPTLSIRGMAAYIVESTGVPGNDTITDFTPGEDRINLHAFAIAGLDALAELTRQRGADVLIDLSEVGGRDVVLLNTNLFDLQAEDFLL